MILPRCHGGLGGFQQKARRSGGGISSLQFEFSGGVKGNGPQRVRAGLAPGGADRDCAIELGHVRHRGNGLQQIGYLYRGYSKIGYLNRPGAEDAKAVGPQVPEIVVGVTFGQLLVKASSEGGVLCFLSKTAEPIESVGGVLRAGE